MKKLLKEIQKEMKQTQLISTAQQEKLKGGKEDFIIEDTIDGI